MHHSLESNASNQQQEFLKQSIDVANLYNASSHLLGNVATIPIDAIPADAAYYDPQQHGSNHHQYQYAAFQPFLNCFASADAFTPFMVDGLFNSVSMPHHQMAAIGMDGNGDYSTIEYPIMNPVNMNPFFPIAAVHHPNNDEQPHPAQSQPSNLNSTQQHQQQMPSNFHPYNNNNNLNPSDCLPVQSSIPNVTPKTTSHHHHHQYSRHASTSQQHSLTDQLDEIRSISSGSNLSSSGYNSSSAHSHTDSHGNEPLINSTCTTTNYFKGNFSRDQSQQMPPISFVGGNNQTNNLKFVGQQIHQPEFDQAALVMGNFYSTISTGTLNENELCATNNNNHHNHLVDWGLNE